MISSTYVFLRTKEKSFVRTYQLEIIEKNVICGQNRAFFFIHFFFAK